MPLTIFFSFSAGVVITSGILLYGPYSTRNAFILGIMAMAFLVILLLRLTRNHWSWSWRWNHHTVPATYLHKGHRRKGNGQDAVDTIQYPSYQPIITDTVAADVASALANCGMRDTQARRLAAEARKRMPREPFETVFQEAVGMGRSK